jgi:hypothetical protein
MMIASNRMLIIPSIVAAGSALQNPSSIMITMYAV